MQEAATGILIDRSREADGIATTVLLSLAAHAAIIAAVVLMPASWRTHRTDSSRTMTISLGGAPGPRQGMTPMATRPVQEVAATPSKTAPIAPPAAKAPEMVEPLKTAKPQPKAAEKVEKPAKQPAVKPVTGPEIKSGAARVETGGQAIPFGGLSTGGGGAGGYLDVKDFCCPDYLQTMLTMIQRHWNNQQSQDGQVIVKFTIQRDGTLTAVQVEKPATYFLNMAAQRAIAETQKVPPLPPQYTEDHLTVHLIFQYQR
jgi:TonB family protein